MEVEQLQKYVEEGNGRSLKSPKELGKLNKGPNSRNSFHFGG